MLSQPFEEPGEGRGKRRSAAGPPPTRPGGSFGGGPVPRDRWAATAGGRADL